LRLSNTFRPFVEKKLEEQGVRFQEVVCTFPRFQEVAFSKLSQRWTRIHAFFEPGDNREGIL